MHADGQAEQRWFAAQVQAQALPAVVVTGLVPSNEPCQPDMGQAARGERQLGYGNNTKTALRVYG